MSRSLYSIFPLISFEGTDWINVELEHGEVLLFSVGQRKVLNQNIPTKKPSDNLDEKKWIIPHCSFLCQLNQVGTHPKKASVYFDFDFHFLLPLKNFDFHFLLPLTNCPREVSQDLNKYIYSMITLP